MWSASSLALASPLSSSSPSSLPLSLLLGRGPLASSSWQPLASSLPLSSTDGRATICTVDTPCQSVELGPDAMTALLGLGLVGVVGVLLLAVIAVRLLTR